MKDSILNTLLNLTAIQSVNGVPHAEDAYVDFLYKELSEWPYFRQYPENLFLTPLEGDKLERHNLIAIVHSGSAKRAILFINHHDVVGIGDPDAFNPLKYKEKLAQAPLTEDARADLESGEWLFGRGVSDMKGGAAVQLSLLKEYSENPQNLNINIIFLSLADEENDGLGVHQAVRTFSAMQKDGWEFLLCIDSEPTITNQEKSGGVIYTGSIGNITIFTLFVGRESHVGEFYDGINAAVLTAKMIYDIEGEPNTADSYDGRHFSPASCLKFKDFTAGYSVTLPARSAVIINLLTAKKSVTEILAYFTQKAKESGEAALRKHYGLETIKVITFSELKNMVTGFEGEISLETTAKEDADIELVNRLITDAGLSGPLAVVGFIPPYCGAKLNEKKTLSEIKAAEAAEDVAAYAEKLTGSRLAVEAVYEGISDLSEMGGVPEDIEVLKDNMAGYGKMITYPFEEMKSLAIPVINLGPIGKDAHKPTERVFIPYLTQTLPLLLKRLIENYNTF